MTEQPSSEPRTAAGRAFVLHMVTMGEDAAFIAEEVAVIEAEAASQPAPLIREALATALYGAHRGLDIEHARYHCDGTCVPAILAALPPAVPEPIDVERLASALDEISDYGMEYDLMSPEEREARRDAAERLAVEYARLAGSVTPAEQRARPWTTAAMDAEEGQR
jgi:hypothetical protein